MLMLCMTHMRVCVRVCVHACMREMRACYITAVEIAVVESEHRCVRVGIVGSMHTEQQMYTQQHWHNDRRHRPDNTITDDVATTIVTLSLMVTGLDRLHRSNVVTNQVSSVVRARTTSMQAGCIMHRISPAVHRR